MILIDWLVKHNVKVLKIACDLDIAVASVYRYLKGEGMHPMRAKKIMEYTKNECSYEELMNPNGKQN